MSGKRITTTILAALIFANLYQVSGQDPPEGSQTHGLPAGTKIKLRMDNEINSGSSEVDDTFTATVSEPVVINEVVMLPVGSVVEGKIIKVKRASRAGRNGFFEVIFESLKLESGQTRRIEATLVRSPEVSNSRILDVLGVLGGTVAGGVIGASSNSDNGALIGAGIGAGAGLAVALLREGTEMRIRSDEEFEVRLEKNVLLPAVGF